MAKSSPDNFLKEEIARQRERASYLDGFRFGFGFFIAWLLGLLVVGLITSGLLFIVHPH